MIACALRAGGRFLIEADDSRMEMMSCDQYVAFQLDREKGK